MPLTIDIHFDQLHAIRWRPGESPYVDEKDFANWLVAEFIKRFKKSIRTQRLAKGVTMSSMYAPLSRDYRKHKKRAGLRIGFWEATHQILRGIQARRVAADHWRIGWDKRVRYRQAKGRGQLGASTGVRVWLIVMWLEFGTKRNGEEYMPSRPLIRPIMANMRKSISRLYVQYLVERRILTAAEARELSRMGSLVPQPKRGTMVTRPTTNRRVALST